MKEVRVSRMTRGAYEPPRLRVVAIADRMLLSYSTEAFKPASGDPSDWGDYGTQEFKVDGEVGKWDDLP